MIIFPAIDLFDGQAVRLFKGDYKNMTVYDKEPVNTALKFKNSGAEWLHVIDLEGAKSGTSKNFDVILKIKDATNLKIQTGGGIRDLKIVEHHLKSGIDRVILGTAAVTNPEFAKDAVKNFGAERIAVSVDINNNQVAIKGWQENSNLNALEFCEKISNDGVKYLISTDISRDGTLTGANVNLYDTLKKIAGLKIIASGGVKSIDDIKKLAELKIYGAIIGKAYYTGNIDIKNAIEVSI